MHKENTSLLIYRSFLKYDGPSFIATAIFAIFAQRNSYSQPGQNNNNNNKTGSQISNCHFLLLSFYGGSVKWDPQEGSVDRSVQWSVDQVRRGGRGPGVSVFGSPLRQATSGEDKQKRGLGKITETSGKLNRKCLRFQKVRDPVAVYKLCAAKKRPSEMNHDNAPFYLAVNTCKNQDSSKPWFKMSAVGWHKLNSLMKLWPKKLHLGPL